MIEALTAYQERNNQQLNAWLDQLPHQEQPLIEAMRYGLTLGGKRARPFLVYATGQMLGCEPHGLDTPACAVECIHAYSLIHDDLPAMDDDDFRRGKASCHKAFGEDMAILAGDILNSFAFELISTEAPNFYNAKQCCEIIRRLSRACGVYGMAGGQVLDLQYTDKEINQAELESIHHLKTGALLALCMSLPAYLESDNSEEQAKLESVGKMVGLLFQVVDDILDVVGTQEDLGKSPNKDVDQNKQTYVSQLGLEGATDYAQTLTKSAIATLDELPRDTQLLSECIQYILDRSQ